MKSCRAVIRRTFIGGYEVYHFNVDYYIAYKLYANTHVVPLFSNKDIYSLNSNNWPQTPNESRPGYDLRTMNKGE